ASLFGLGTVPGGPLIGAWSQPPYATIGLGTGTMGSYTKPFQHITYYEIDDHVREYSLPSVGGKQHPLFYWDLPAYDEQLAGAGRARLFHAPDKRPKTRGQGGGDQGRPPPVHGPGATAGRRLLPEARALLSRDRRRCVQLGRDPRASPHQGGRGTVHEQAGARRRALHPHLQPPPELGAGLCRYRQRPGARLGAGTLDAVLI